MPTYQYACTSCDERLEAVQSFSDAPLTECPSCSGRLRKVFSAVGVVFKGSGFYKNDSRTPAKTETGAGGDKPAAAGSGSDTGGGSGSGASADKPSGGGSKPAASGPAAPSTPVAKTA